MRSINSIKSMITAIIANGLNIALGFLVRAIFVRTLGAEYLGLNGLFSNIISMLAIIELGIGSAIIYHLYKPVAENDIDKIKKLMTFYKKCFNIIALVVFLIGIAIMPFLNLIVGENNIEGSIHFYFLLFLIDAVCSYLLVYKRSIIQANQKNYIINIIELFYVLILNILRIVILHTNNYTVYLSVSILLRLVENIIISIIANKLYPYIKEKTKEKLDEETLFDIKKKVKALVFHKVGNFVVTGTDNIIISKFLGIISVRIVFKL